MAIIWAKDYLFKYSPWEESVRVPLIIAGPDIAEGAISRTPVSLVDLYPTCIDFAAMQAPHNLDGHSLRGLLKDPQTGTWDGPDFSLSACASKVKVEKNQPANSVDQHFSVRTERYRYIHCRNGEEELYDHLQDPNEWKNQANNPEYQPVIRAMRVRLRSATDIGS